jgi:hypothetical protein
MLFLRFRKFCCASPSVKHSDDGPVVEPAAEPAAERPTEHFSDLPPAGAPAVGPQQDPDSPDVSDDDMAAHFAMCVKGRRIAVGSA